MTKPTPPTRELNLEPFVSVRDVTSQLGCSESKAYEHLRSACGRAPGERGMLRVRLSVWNAYVREVIEGPRVTRAALARGLARPRAFLVAAEHRQIAHTQPRRRKKVDAVPSS